MYVCVCAWGGYVGVHVHVCLCMRVCLCRKGKLKYMYMYVNRFLPGKHIRYFLLQTTIGYFDYIKPFHFTLLYIQVPVHVQPTRAYTFRINKHSFKVCSFLKHNSNYHKRLGRKLHQSTSFHTRTHQLPCWRLFLAPVTHQCSITTHVHAHVHAIILVHIHVHICSCSNPCAVVCVYMYMYMRMWLASTVWSIISPLMCMASPLPSATNVASHSRAFLVVWVSWALDTACWQTQTWESA